MVGNYYLGMVGLFECEYVMYCRTIFFRYSVKIFFSFHQVPPRPRCSSTSPSSKHSLPWVSIPIYPFFAPHVLCVHLCCLDMCSIQTAHPVYIFVFFKDRAVVTKPKPHSCLGHCGGISPFGNCGCDNLCREMV